MTWVFQPNLALTERKSQSILTKMHWFTLVRQMEANVTISRLPVLAAALAAALSGADPAASVQTRKPTVEEIRARYTAERLAKIRAAMAARIAVIDQAEKGYRPPTAEEAAALAPVSGGSNSEPVVYNLPGGVSAVRGDQVALEYLRVKLDADGKLAVAHNTAAPAERAAGTAVSTKKEQRNENK